MAGRPPISETELLVLRALWRLGAATVRELDEVLRKKGRGWAYNTILTLLQRLMAKGYVKSDPSSLAHVYSPAVSREEHLRQRLREIRDKLCDGMAAPLVRAMVEDHSFSREEIEELRELVDRLSPAKKEQEAKGSRRKGRRNP